MNPLVTIFPVARRVRIPLTRDQVMFLMVATNELLLGLETYLAHLINGTITPKEWIPITFGPTAGILLVIAGLISLRWRSAANIMASLVFMASIIVGLLGAYFHLIRAILPDAPAGAQVSIPLLVWAPPLLGPLTFALVGLLGIGAIWVENPPDSGRLDSLIRVYLSLPFSKTRLYFLLVSMGCLATVTSSVLDHARTNFSNPWLWLPTAIGIFSTVVSVLLGMLDDPTRKDLTTYAIAMLLMILVGVLGMLLHILHDLASQNNIVFERFIRDAPILAPMLFADIGTIGLIVLLDPVDKARNEP